MENEQDALSSSQYVAATVLVSQDDTSFFSLYLYGRPHNSPIQELQVLHFSAGQDLPGAEASTVQELASITILQTYQAMYLTELGTLICQRTIGGLLNDVNKML